MFYNGLPKQKVLEIYDFVIKKRKEDKLGQRRISRFVEKKFGTKIHEGTIANWIYLKKVPFENEKTQFKPKPKPDKNDLYNLYIKQRKSSQKIAKKYNVSTIIVINWLKFYKIPIRTHKESMNTPIIKMELREKKLKRPTKNFKNLSSEKAYILGVLCGDGCISKKGIRLEIRNDKEFINKFSDYIQKVYGLEYKHYYYEKRNSFVLNINSEIVCLDLLKYGNFGTFNWRVPKKIINSKDERIISNFLKGIYDSEGCCSRYCINFTSANKKGIEGINKLLRKLSIYNKIGYLKRGYYTINITGIERFKLFLNKIGFTIKRKSKRLNLKDGRTRNKKSKF